METFLRFFFLFFIFFNVFCETTNTASSIHILKSKKDHVHEDKHGELRVKGATETFVCSNNQNCQKIEEFDVNHVSNCNEAYLQISFNTVINGVKTKTSGFFPSNGILIQDDQIFTDVCKKIKR